MKENKGEQPALGLKLKRSIKYEEIRSIGRQVSLLYSEIQLRERLLEQLYEKIELLQKEAQVLSDILLQQEYDSLVKNNI